MHFNPDKCEVIRITTKRKIIPSSYFIHGKELNITSKGKYLGINISQNLSWNNHIDNVCRKANNTTAFLHRNLSSCSANIITFVRPQLEYASSVWAPHTQSNINKLESVQRRAARFATGNYNTTSSVTTMLNRAGLQQQHIHTEFKITMLAQGRDYVQLNTRSAVLESDCLYFLFEGFQVQGCCCGLW
jgi:hypothetical protein